MESSRPLTSEEEALKRNTDCVYFLASPLTCKKGNECEFRHSEGARVNPRDCYYWLNGNCLNPKCQFRHPPLDGLFETSGTPLGPSAQAAASKHIPVAAYAPNPYNPSKQTVPCYYFQKGQCLKGDKCSFLHSGYPANNLVAQQSTNGPPAGTHNPQQPTNGPKFSAINHAVQQEMKMSTSFTETSQKVSWGLKECSSAPQSIPKAVSAKQVDSRFDALHSPAISESKAQSGHLVQNYEPPRSHPSVAPLSSDSTQSRPHHRPLQSAEEEHYLNGRDADEFLGESSPGFDVLVDDDVGDADYYHNEEDHGNRSMADFDYHRPDYENGGVFERDQYNKEKIEYDRYDRRTDGQYGRNHHRASSERASERAHKRRPMHRESSHDEVDGADLRHRLLKRRRVHDRRSDISPDSIGESRRSDNRNRYVGDRYRIPSSGRERRYEQRPLSSRLQGRISLPVRSPPHQPIEMQFETDRGRLRDRLSQSSAINYQQRPQDRMPYRNEEFAADGRGFRAHSNRRDDGDPSKFAGPKSLAELKGSKFPRSSIEQQEKRSDAPEDLLSFEGPKPLSDILKKKKDGNNGTSHEGMVDSAFDTTTSPAYHVSDAEDPQIEAVEGEDEGLKPTEGDGELTYSDQPSAKSDAHEDPETLDQGENDFEYEAVEGADLNAYEDDEIQDDEDDDEDDFAKKVGALFS